MFFDANGFVIVFPNAGLEAPAEGQYQQGQEPLDALTVAQVSVFEIEASRFEAGEQSLNYPTTMHL